MPHLLAFGLRIPRVRWLLARMRWPRPEHLARMSTSQMHGYIRAIGIEAEAKAALAQYRGEDDHSEADSGVLSPESRSDRRSGAAIP